MNFEKMLKSEEMIEFQYDFYDGLFFMKKDETLRELEEKVRDILAETLRKIKLKGKMNEVLYEDIVVIESDESMKKRDRVGFALKGFSKEFNKVFFDIIIKNNKDKIEEKNKCSCICAIM